MSIYHVHNHYLISGLLEVKRLIDLIKETAQLYLKYPNKPFVLISFKHTIR